jgi:hypothetical protein
MTGSSENTGKLPSLCNLEVKMLNILKVATVAALLAAPIAVHAQGVIGGMQPRKAMPPPVQLVRSPAARWAARSAG